MAQQQEEAPQRKTPKREKTTAKRVHAAPKAPDKAPPPPPPPAKKPPNNQMRSIITCALGVLMALFAVIPGSRLWLSAHNFLLGMFGIGVVFIPMILVYTGWLIGQDKTKEAMRPIVMGLLLTIILSTSMQVFLGEPLLDDLTLTDSIIVEVITKLYEDGKRFRGGGLLSGVTAIPLILAFDYTGAKIVIVLILVVLVMLMTNKSITEMLQMLLKPFKWLWGGITMAATRGMDEEDDDDDDDDENDEEDEDDIITVEPEPAPAEEESRDIIEEFPRFIRGSKRRLLGLLTPQAEPALPAVPEDGETPPDAEGEEPPRTRRRQRRDEDKHMEEVAYILSTSGDAAPETLQNIDVALEMQQLDTQPPAASELNYMSDPVTNHAKMSVQEDRDFMQIVADAAKEDSRKRQNKLPWSEGEPDESQLDQLDESVYDEEPVIPYIAPPVALLKRADNSANAADKTAELTEKGTRLVETLASFGVTVKIVGIRRGPTVTRYEIQPAAGVKIAKITSLADDIGLNLGGQSVRIEAPIPGKPAVGVEVPNDTKDTVSLREILESPEFQNSQSKLTFAVGKDIDGNVILGDIAKMPHMIIAGTTGSGKSVCTNSIIMSILFHASPDEVRMVLIDPKVVEFQPYDGIPHLLIPVITQAQKAAGALNWAVLEMERRYALCADYGVRDLKGYNTVAEKNPELKKLPQILIIIDEFADLMMAAGKEVESSVIRIAQKARAAGIHLVIATQRPTVDVITGLIKSNVPSRIGMSVKSAQDSRIILDATGAETLLGNGDLLFYPNGWREPKRVQGCFCSDSEVEAVASFLKNNGVGEYDSEIMDAVEANTPRDKGEKLINDEENGELTGDEALVLKAAELAVDAGQLSTTALQRRLKLGYAKAARIVDDLEERGIVGPSEGAKPRKVLMSPQELTEWKLRIAANGNTVE